MNILKNTLINGEIYEEYAFLSYELVFENTSNAAAVADYAFEIPDKSYISGMKIGTKDGRLINTTVTAVSHLAQIFAEKEPFAMLRQSADGKCLLSIKELPQSRDRIFIDVYTPLPRIDDGQRLVIPVLKSASINIVLNSDADVMSPTHRINDSRDGLRCITAEADSDFCLCIINTPMRNSAIAVKRDFGGEMLCRFYPSPQFYRGTENAIKQILFIYDATGSLRGGAANAAREVILAMAESFNKAFSLIIATDKPTLAACGDFANSADKLITALADAQKFGGSLAESFVFAKEYVKDGVLPILVCGEQLIEGEYAARKAAKCFDGSRFCAVTIGDSKAAEYITRIAQRCESIFAMDNIKKRAEQIAKSFLWSAENSVEAECRNADTMIVGNPMSMYDGVTVYASYEDGIPKEFVLKNGECAEKFILDQIPVYKSFAPIGLVLAAELCKQAEKRLGICSADEILKVKKYLENTGVEFSLLNGETAMIANDGTDMKAIRVVIEDKKTDKDSFKDRVSMFRETGVADETEKKWRVALCRDMILKSVRADGAICTDGEYVRKLRVAQTMLCVLALVASGGYEEYKSIINAAKDYMGETSVGEMSFTKDSAEAAKMLRSVKHSAACEMPTDILTAALLLAEN